MAEKFDQRLQDISVEKMIYFPDGSIQVNGHTLDGKHTWILLTCREEYTVKHVQEEWDTPFDADRPPGTSGSWGEA